MRSFVCAAFSRSRLGSSQTWRKIGPASARAKKPSLGSLTRAEPQYPNRTLPRPAQGQNLCDWRGTPTPGERSSRLHDQGRRFYEPGNHSFTVIRQRIRAGVRSCVTRSFLDAEHPARSDHARAGCQSVHGDDHKNVQTFTKIERLVEGVAKSCAVSR
jgi:hypothetical protein